MEGGTCPYAHINGATTPHSSKGYETPLSTSSSTTSLESVSHSGFLKKKRTFGRWKERWYVLSSGSLSEYKLKSDKALKALSEWNLRDILRVEDADNITGSTYTFVLYFKDNAQKPLFFQASSKNDLAEWKTDLEKVIHTTKEDNRIHLEAFNDPVVLSDERAVIIDLNEPAMELFGYTKEEAVGQNVSIFIPDAIAHRHEAFVNEYIRTNQKRLIGMPRKMNARKKDGSIFPIMLSLGEMFSENKKRFIATMRDMSEEEADYSNQKLMEALNEKVDHLASKVKHEFEKTTKEMAKNQAKLKHKKDQLKKENAELQNELAELSRELSIEKKSREIAAVALASLMFERPVSSEGVLEGIKTLITEEVNASTSLTTVFREDTPNTKKISAFMFVTGADYLTHILEPTILRIIKKRRSLEINSHKLEGIFTSEEKEAMVDIVKRRQKKIVKYAAKILNQILNSTTYFPDYFREIFDHLKQEIIRKFPAEDSAEFAGNTVASSFLFLRFIVPVVIRPDAYALIRTPIPEQNSRMLLYIGKILQHLANGVLFTEEEMGPMNDFINNNKEALQQFVHSVIGRRRREQRSNSENSLHSIRSNLSALSYHSTHHGGHSNSPHSSVLNSSVLQSSTQHILEQPQSIIPKSSTFPQPKLPASPHSLHPKAEL